MIDVIAPLCIAPWFVVHIGSHAESSVPFHYSYLAIGFVAGSVLASGVYWYYSNRPG